MFGSQTFQHQLVQHLQTGLILPTHYSPVLDDYVRAKLMGPATPPFPRPARLVLGPDFNPATDESPHWLDLLTFRQVGVQVILLRSDLSPPPFLTREEWERLLVQLTTALVYEVHHPPLLLHVQAVCWPPPFPATRVFLQQTTGHRAFFNTLPDLPFLPPPS